MFSIHIGLGSTRGPVEPGHPVARARRGGDLLFFLRPRPDPPARAAAPPDICPGGTGHEQVRRNEC